MSRPVPAASSPRSNFAIEVFFDGECPLCMREIRMLQRRDKHRKIKFTDISSENFDEDSVGISWNNLMDRIHGRRPDGTIVEGIEVFRELYSAIGFGPVVALTRLPGISQILNLGYHLFAKNRLRITGRCTDETCPVHNRPQER